MNRLDYRKLAGTPGTPGKRDAGESPLHLKAHKKKKSSGQRGGFKIVDF